MSPGEVDLVCVVCGLAIFFLIVVALGDSGDRFSYFPKRGRRS